MPDGMTLKVPFLEAREGGNYQYEHTDEKGGTYICTGFFREFVPNKKLVQIDNVRGPDGKMLFENLECVIDFREIPGGTEITVTQSGFENEEMAKGCEDSWNQCFEKLGKLLGVKAESRSGSSGSEQSSKRP